MADKVEPGTIAKLRRNELQTESIHLQVSKFKQREDGCFNFEVSDGRETYPARVPAKVAQQIQSGTVKEWSVVRTDNYIPDSGTLIITERMDVVAQLEGPLGATIKAEPMETERPAPLTMKAEGVSNLQRAQSLATPKHAKENAGPYKTPLTEVKAMGGGGGITPPSTGPGSARKTLVPIAALNPYNNNWTIKARVSNKGNKRSFSQRGQDTSVFSVELVDEQGTQIEATFWRELADATYDLLEEGKVYFFSRGKVKPANKQYSTVRNDYSIDLSSGSEVEECPDDDPSKMQAKPSYVPIDSLGPYIGKKTNVDVIGIVKEVGAIGSIKRKTDGSDVARRDVTIVDKSEKQVQLTLWGRNAEVAGSELEMESHSNPVLSVTSVRITDYNGISLSSLQRSSVQINPNCKEADDLREWWCSAGAVASFTHAGDGLASALKSGSGSGGSSERVFLADVRKQPGELPSVDAKPEFCNVTATIMQIEPEQSLYYTADPDSGKKVIPDGDAWRCASDDKICYSMERRYMMRVNLMDATGELGVTIFGAQGETLLGMKADEVAALKEADDTAAYRALLNAKQFSHWSLVLQSRSMEYNGELKQRCTLQSLSAPNYVEESKFLLSKIRVLATAA